ncbi:alpha/beta fold hydrolase [Pseudonocardia sp. Cha107L01]|uniref:alpha/beta fold hydrolase n=1 Tax=Pseudonocardia sp. Cha107L01 TaxID=3457576 RepID=UPI00403EACA2
MAVRRRFVDTRYGQVHLAEHGSGDPVLLLHQTPRSWDEYRDVLPLLGAHRRAIALDTLGFGDSARPDEPWTVELFAAGVLAAADALGLTGFDLVGHHTGGVIAVEVAAAAPERVGRLVLSATRMSTRELTEWGLLERSGTRYHLGLRRFELGQLVPRQRILRQAALPFMEDLLMATQETVHFAIREGLDVLYIEKIIGHCGLREQSRVAGRLPLHSTATGKVILAYSPAALFDDVVKEGFTALTRHTTMSVALLRKQVDRVRLEGIAVEREEVRLGYLSTAVPVFGSRGMLAGALSITGPTSRLNVDRVAGALRTAAAGISRAVAAMSCEAGSEGCISAQCPLPDCGRH